MTGEAPDPQLGAPVSPSEGPSQDPTEGLRNPFRREADAFRLLLIAVVAIGIAIGLALLSPVAGVIAGAILLILAVWRSAGWLREWLGAREPPNDQ